MPINEVVKCYDRKYKRKNKEYIISQCVINLKKGSNLEHEQEVIIYKLSEFAELQEEHEKALQELKELISSRDSQINILTSERDFFKARFEKEQEDNQILNDENVRLANRGLFDYFKNAIKFRSDKAIAPPEK